MSCKFCDLASSGGPKGTADQVIAESESFFAISSIGGFIPGWTLICPKEHQLNLSAAYLDDRFIEFATYIYKVVVAEYGDCVIFEHGANFEGSRTACGANHAHLHIVPFSADIESLAQNDSRKLSWQQHSIDQFGSVYSGSEYFFCANKFLGNKTIGLLSILDEPQSQFFRKLLAKSVGLADFFDYKRYPFNQISNETSNRLIDSLSLTTI